MSHPQTLFKETTLHGPSVLRSRQRTAATATARATLARMRESGQYDCFRLRWLPAYDDMRLADTWPAPPVVYWDSDVAKWIEGACYALHHLHLDRQQQHQHDDDHHHGRRLRGGAAAAGDQEEEELLPGRGGDGDGGDGEGRGDAQGVAEELDAAVRELVDMIRGAQHDDGYLNVYFSVIEPDKRWSNLRDQHELYNCGHLIEAALAHQSYYKNKLLMEPVEKYVKLIRSVFGPGQEQRHGYPGHPEIELALLRLFAATGSEDAYDLAQYFIEERGNQTGQEGMPYFSWERKQRGESPWKRPDSYPMHTADWYSQAHAPILDQRTIEGHSVRALYLFTGVADLLCLDELALKSYEAKSRYLATLHCLWDSMVHRKMYLTGGVGSLAQWEGFGIDYFLPQGTDEGGCYNETCASIGVVMLAERMLHLELDSKYSDIMELCLYNNIMTGTFTYVNQLASSEQDKSVRTEWFATSCCPPNVTRLYGSIGGYLWDYGSQGGSVYVNVHLYTTAKVAFSVDEGNVVFEQKSNWPWEGKISFQLQAPPRANATVRLRIPAWAQGQYTLTPSLESAIVHDGYLALPPSYLASNKTFAIEIGGFQPRYISPHPYTNQHTLSLARGPLIYSVEDVDNAWEHDHFRNVGISSRSGVSEHDEVMGKGPEEGYIGLRTRGWVRSIGSDWSRSSTTPGLQRGGGAHAPQTDATVGVELRFIPYYLRANRSGRGHMRVGLLDMTPREFPG
ncbi:glycoside hydrolase family 127 protein [Xylariaceae sp. FL0804]|nr:glycoside hydrolase family 127 protein [Xylariaceae sp. FL0804]